MPKRKMKTHQATAKRLRQTGRKKFMKRKAGQDHFNSRDRGVTTMGKRRDEALNKASVSAVKRLLPYSS
jgi:large subunit ribosomal protein L35